MTVVELDPIWLDWPYARIRRELAVDRGTVVRFVVQLEYDWATVTPDAQDPNWRVVARFDHDSVSEGGHDVSDEGLHLDIYRKGTRHERLRGFPALPTGRAMRYAEEYLIQHSDSLLARFEHWHDSSDP